MTLADIVATLSNEPFNRPLSEIKRLTMFQVYNIIFRSRDRKTGKLDMDPVPVDAPLSDQGRFELFCKLRKLPGWWVRERYKRDG